MSALRYIALQCWMFHRHWLGVRRVVVIVLFQLCFYTFNQLTPGGNSGRSDPQGTRTLVLFISRLTIIIQSLARNKVTLVSRDCSLLCLGSNEWLCMACRCVWIAGEMREFYN